MAFAPITSLREALRGSAAARLLQSFARMQTQLDRLQLAIGRLELDARMNAGGDFNAHEVGVFSQWGEDGLIAYLISRVPIERPCFVEFGVEDYREANTRFLLVARDWSGLVIDGSAAHVRGIQSDDISWRHDLTARHAFVTRDNINALLEQAGFTGDIGLLSIDIDGNDYWVWEAIDVVSPRIVVVEYNSLWGAERAVTVPYDSSFVRGEKHFSNLYYGASIAALARLGKTKGYSLVGGNKAGNNAFFVRDDVLGSVAVVDPIAAYRRAGFREARSESGALTFADFAERTRVVGHLPVFDIDSGREVSIASLGSP